MNHRGEIENLLYAYQERLDAGDLVGMAALFEHATVGGVDEVGRGAWAGPVSVGVAVVTPLFLVAP